MKFEPGQLVRLKTTRDIGMVKKVVFDWSPEATGRAWPDTRVLVQWLTNYEEDVNEEFFRAYHKGTALSIMESESGE